MRKSFCALLALLLLAPVVRAQRKPLSLYEAVAAGLEASPALHASRMKAESSAARARQVAAARFPSFRLGAGYTRLSEVPPFEVTLPISPKPIVVSQNYFNSWSLRLAVQQPVFTGLVRRKGA